MSPRKLLIFGPLPIRIMAGRGTVVLRRQADGGLLIVIENPWGTD